MTNETQTKTERILWAGALNYEQETYLDLFQFEREDISISIDVAENLAEKDPALGYLEKTGMRSRAYVKKDPKVEEVIRNLTRGGLVDYVIIGNNEGAGIRKAAAVAEPMRENNSCILWGRVRDTEPYEELGFKHFIPRENFPEFFLEHLNAKYGRKE